MRALFPLQQKLVCFLLLFVIFLSHLYAFEVNITGKELGVDIKPEFNRSFYFCYDISFFGSLEINKYINLESGIAMGRTGKVFDIDLFVKGGFDLPLPVPLSFNLLYMYNGTPDYLTHIHTALPLLALKGQWAGISVGTTLRSTIFDQESAILEPILALSVFVNFYQTEKMKFGLEAANFDNFHAGNMGSYFLKFYSLIHFAIGGTSQRLSVINEIRIEQTGSVGLDANFYGVAYRGGVVYKW
ncbi:hypothetical protein AGMMS49579_07170 [Spirochaetia bacterium]|nr:hypothetical protein AGMMS49579_07170 [Spirochaetia bacterium]